MVILFGLRLAYFGEEKVVNWVVGGKELNGRRDEKR